MKILITGAGGFIGQFLTQELLKDPLNRLLLTDRVDFLVPSGSRYPENATIVRADLLSEASNVVHRDLKAVFILHGIMSSGAEADFDMGFRVNVDATRNLLDCIRTTAPSIRVVYASSLAVYGRPFPESITETCSLHLKDRTASRNLYVKL
jgi:nucleoside-diphosphate-sugar epimerase